MTTATARPVVIVSVLILAGSVNLIHNYYFGAEKTLGVDGLADFNHKEINVKPIVAPVLHGVALQVNLSNISAF